MATSFTVDPSGLDGYDWDEQGVGLHYGGALAGSGAAVRSGVLRGLNYTAGSLLQGNLSAGVFVQAASSVGNGAYNLTNTGTLTFDHPTADGTNPRNDLIVAKVNAVGTTSSYRHFELVTGTPASTPVDPTIGGSLGNGGYVPLFRVRVAAGATTLGTITDLRPWTTAAGGVVPIAGAAAAPSLASSLPTNAVVWDSTVGRFLVRDSSTGLTDYDPRPQVKRFDLSRSSVPANNSGEEVAGFGYKMAFAVNAPRSTAVTPATTLEDSTTRLVVGVTGFYRITATVRTVTNLLAPAKVVLQWSTDDFATSGTFNTVWTERERTLEYYGLDEYIGAGTKLRLMVARTVTGSGGVENLSGELTLTMLRTA